MTAVPPYLGNLFEPGRVLTSPNTSFENDDDVRLRVEHQAITALVISSGKIAAGEPMGFPVEPFACSVLKGEYGVDLVLARVLDKNALSFGQRVVDQQYIAAAIVRLGAGSPARWELASRVAKEPSFQECYGVDSGLGSFADGGLAEALASDERLRNHLMPMLQKSEKENLHGTWRWAGVRTDRGSLLLFTSGFGDGFYTSWWGFDAAGERLALVTDFKVFAEF